MSHIVKKHFKVTVDGRDFDVFVEEIPDVTNGPIGAVPVRSPVAASATRPSTPMPAATSAGPGTVTAPMAGKVLKVVVKVGDAVHIGDTVVVLEAMKMETNVVAGAAGVVKEILVSEGGSVNTGAVMARIE